MNAMEVACTAILVDTLHSASAAAAAERDAYKNKLENLGAFCKVLNEDWAASTKEWGEEEIWSREQANDKNTILAQVIRHKSSKAWCWIGINC